MKNHLTAPKTIPAEGGATLRQTKTSLYRQAER